MTESLFNNVYNPDVLSCLANLSNDEVFTPPEIVNQMLDLLPQDLFENPDTTFLDPACKSGVFLREIAKRLIKGLEPQFPDLQDRLDHIYHKQLYGIAITELTSLLSRRSLYCSKYPNSEFSISKFDTADGNIRYKRIQHSWKNGRCVFCGANLTTYNRGDDLETHAYEFIHITNPEALFNMKFDVIISNPPYHLKDGGAQASAKPIYQLFVEQSKKLKPHYLTMIIPSRWMSGGKGLDTFRDAMIHDKKIQVLHDFANSKDCFNGVEIKGGVCYFLRSDSFDGMCDVYRHDMNGITYSKRFLAEDGADVYIRYTELVSIKSKVQALKEYSFDSIVSTMKPYGLRGDLFSDPKKYGLPPLSDKVFDNGCAILGLIDLKRVWKYVPNDYPFPKDSGLYSYKIFIPRNYGCGEIGEIAATPVLATPGEACTETFIQIGRWDTKEEAENALTYLKTKFFRCLVGIRKNDQSAGRGVYKYVPMQDFSKPWTDEELYAKYNLTEDEIAFIESMIKPME